MVLKWGPNAFGQHDNGVRVTVGELNGSGLVVEQGRLNEV